MIDMSSLMEEMDSMPSFDAPSKKTLKTSGVDLSAKATESSLLKQREKEEAAMKAADAGEKKKSKKRIVHSKFHGDAPLNLMTEFLSLVSSNQLQAALDICPQILKYEPDNILIKMYQEDLREALRLEAQAKKDGTYESSSSSSEEEDDEEDDEDEDSDDPDETDPYTSSTSLPSNLQDMRNETADAKSVSSTGIRDEPKESNYERVRRIEAKLQAKDNRDSKATSTLQGSTNIRK